LKDTLLSAATMFLQACCYLELDAISTNKYAVNSINNYSISKIILVIVLSLCSRYLEFVTGFKEIKPQMGVVCQTGAQIAFTNLWVISNPKQLDFCQASLFFSVGHPLWRGWQERIHVWRENI